MLFRSMPKPRKFPRSLASLALSVPVLFAASSGTVLAGEKQPKSDLPGVDGTYSIVKPAPPEPEPEQRSTESELAPGQWDVTVSGTITFDVTTGKLPPPRR